MQVALGASLWTILAAAVAGWLVGALWYGVLFGRQWMAAAGLTEEKLKGPDGKVSPEPFIVSFVLEFVMAYILAVLYRHTAPNELTVVPALLGAFYLWLGFVATTQIINHRYMKLPWALSVIDCGHWLAVLLVQAAVMALLGL
jgi:hypothetical protein